MEKTDKSYLTHTTLLTQSVGEIEKSYW